jgi:hypothetical protein
MLRLLSIFSSVYQPPLTAIDLLDTLSLICDAFFLKAASLLRDKKRRTCESNYLSIALAALV